MKKIFIPRYLLFFVISFLFFLIPLGWNRISQINKSKEFKLRLEMESVYSKITNEQLLIDDSEKYFIEHERLQNKLKNNNNSIFNYTISEGLLIGIGLTIFLINLIFLYMDYGKTRSIQFEIWDIKIEKNINAIIKIILSILFIGALFKMPFYYYEIMRFLGMVGFSILGYKALIKENQIFMVIWFSSALFINPFFKITLIKPVWNVIDIIWVILLVISIFNKKVT